MHKILAIYRLLRDEHSKRQPNGATITELMKLTFFFRRKEICEKMKPITEIVAVYPFIADKEQVSETA